MLEPVPQLATYHGLSAPPRRRPASLEAILVLGAFVVAGLIWLAVGAAVMRRAQTSMIRPAQLLPRADAGKELETLL
jgi:hypothetical protein